MSKFLAIAALLLLTVACGTSAPPTLAPTATPRPVPTPTAEPTVTPQPTPTPTAVPTATPLPTPTSTPLPTAIPTPTAIPVVEAAHGAPSEGDGHDPSLLAPEFPEISEKMKGIRPVYTAYFHSADWQAPGKYTTVGEVFALLRMDNIVIHEGHQQISPAMVVDHEPDLIIADSIEAVVENPDLSGLHMVSDTAHIPHHIFELGEDYSFDSEDPRFKATVQAFAAFAYPDTFTVKEEPGHDHGHSHDHSHGH